MNRPLARTLACIPGLLALATPLVAAPARAATEFDSAAMLELAETSGCSGCHQIESGARGPDGRAPIGPAWRIVSAKYAGQAGAEKKLIALVMSGSTPFDRHWKGKETSPPMPVNAKAINESDARMLVQWILGLDARK
jgi:cytochrome c